MLAFLELSCKCKSMGSGIALKTWDISFDGRLFNTALVEKEGGSIDIMRLKESLNLDE